MSVYYGVVRDNHIELEGGARLTEGTRVEVHITSDDTATRASDLDSTVATEEMVQARLRAAGLLAAAPPADDEDEDEEFEPVEVQGEPLSEQIIRERR